jgi:hypothetical protein
VFTGTEFDRSRPRLTLPPDLTAVPIVNLHMYRYNVFAAEGVNEKPRSGITAWPKFAARDRSASLCFVWVVAGRCQLVGARSRNISIQLSPGYSQNRTMFTLTLSLTLRCCLFARSTKGVGRTYPFSLTLLRFTLLDHHGQCSAYVDFKCDNPRSSSHSAARIFLRMISCSSSAVGSLSIFAPLLTICWKCGPQ